MSRCLTLAFALWTACAGAGTPADTDTDVATPTDRDDDDTTPDKDDEDPPDTPSDLAVQVTSTTSVRLTWSDERGADTFEVEQSSGDGFDDVDDPDDPALDIDGLTPGQRYTWRVRACSDDAGCSDRSDEVTVTLPEGAVPVAPDDLVVTPDGTTQLVLDWNDHADDETGYVIAWSVDFGATFEDYPPVAVNTQSATDGGLTPNTTYCYRVRARNTHGDSPSTPTVCATTDANAAPSAPVDVTATLSADLQILLTWRNLDANNSYVVYESVNGGSFQSSGTVPDGNLAGAYVSGLSAGTTYRYKVAAVNGFGTSAQSAQSNAVTTPAAAPTTRTAFVNQSAYPIISLVVDGVERFPTAPGAIPPGASLALELAPGAHTYTAENGFWSGGSRSGLYTFSGSVTQDAGQTESVTLNAPSLAQLLTRFSSSASYVGEYWVGTSLHWKTLRFTSDGSYTLYDDGVSVGSGTTTLVSYPGSFMVTFQLSGVPGVEALLDERTGSFFLRNGPADWPTLHYGWRGP